MAFSEEVGVRLERREFLDSASALDPRLLQRRTEKGGPPYLQSETETIYAVDNIEDLIR